MQFDVVLDAYASLSFDEETQNLCFRVELVPKDKTIYVDCTNLETTMTLSEFFARFDIDKKACKRAFREMEKNLQI